MTALVIKMPAQPDGEDAGGVTERRRLRDVEAEEEAESLRGERE